jgi:NADP-dependent 3-hydroxy acid dehydrogenase YdfG
MTRSHEPIFDRKNALIYGAAKGIGRAVALEFARRGANVAVADIDLEGAKQTAAQVAATGTRSFAVKCDVLSDLSVRETAVAPRSSCVGQVRIYPSRQSIKLPLPSRMACAMDRSLSPLTKRCGR